MLSFVWWFACSLIVLSTLSSDYVIDSWGLINLPFTVGVCQHSLPDTSTFSLYNCSGEVSTRKTFEKSLCSNASVFEDANFTGDGTNCDDSTSTTTKSVLLQAFCEDFSPPARREISLVPNVCVDVGSTVIKLACDSSYFSTYFYESSDACSADTNAENAEYTRILEIDDCSVWLKKNETNFSFDIKAEVCVCARS